MAADSMTFTNNATGTIKWTVKALSADNDFHMMVLPTGTQLASGSKIEYPADTTAFTANTFVVTTSTDQLFAWPSIIGQSTTVANIHNTQVSGTITSATSRDYTYSTTNATNATRGYNIGPANGACASGESAVNYFTLGLTGTTKDFSSISISNTAINLQSPSSKAFT